MTTTDRSVHEHFANRLKSIARKAHIRGIETEQITHGAMFWIIVDRITPKSCQLIVDQGFVLHSVKRSEDNPKFLHMMIGVDFIEKNRRWLPLLGLPPMETLESVMH